MTACLTVIIPCFITKATVPEIVDRVLDSPLVAEIIVIDGGSTDGIRASLLASTTPG